MIPALVSKDKHATLIPVVMAGTMDEALENVDKLHETAVAAQSDGFTVAQTGEASLNEMFTRLAEKRPAARRDLRRPRRPHRARCRLRRRARRDHAAGAQHHQHRPGLALTALIGQIYPMNIFVLNILTMMGLAVGIDYTLFVISRYREERARGLEKIEAIAATGATANRAIFFSGMTVVLAMIGMVIVPIDIMIGMGIGVMLVVFTTLLTALIALPAVMSVLGDRINALRVPFLGRAASGAPTATGASGSASRTASCAARSSGSASPSWRCWRSPLRSW